MTAIGESKSPAYMAYRQWYMYLDHYITFTSCSSIININIWSEKFGHHHLITHMMLKLHGKPPVIIITLAAAGTTCPLLNPHSSEAYYRSITMKLQIQWVQYAEQNANEGQNNVKNPTLLTIIIQIHLTYKKAHQLVGQCETRPTSSHSHCRI